MTRRLGIEPGIAFNWVDLAEGSFLAKLLTARVTYNLSPRKALMALVQYNSAGNVIGANVRFRWEFRPGPTCSSSTTRAATRRSASAAPNSAPAPSSSRSRACSGSRAAVRGEELEHLRQVRHDDVGVVAAGHLDVGDLGFEGYTPSGSAERSSSMGNGDSRRSRATPSSVRTRAPSSWPAGRCLGGGPAGSLRRRLALQQRHARGQGRREIDRRPVDLLRPRGVRRGGSTGDNGCSWLVSRWREATWRGSVPRNPARAASGAGFAGRASDDIVCRKNQTVTTQR